ncbi:MAG: ATP-dependent zinc metalloprotease FtsH, partial [Shewanella sp.]
GRSMGKAKAMSDETATLIDTEVKAFIDKNYSRAKQILQDNVDILHSMKDALMKYETIDSLQIDDLMNRREVRQPADWQADENASNDKGNGKGEPAVKVDEVVKSAPAETELKDADESPVK